MADVSKDDSYDDAVLLELDCVDATKALSVIRDEDAQLKFYKSGPRSIERSEQAVKHRLVHPQFGSTFGHGAVVDMFGPFALLTMNTSFNSQAEAQHCVQALQNLANVLPVRWGGNHLLIHCDNLQSYTHIGESFVQRRLEKTLQEQCLCIEPALLRGSPICYLELNSSSCEALLDALLPPLQPFSASFNYLSLRSCDQADEPLSDRLTQLPRFSLTLMFSGQNQNLAVKSLRCLESTWDAVIFSDIVIKALDLDVTGPKYFVHQHLDLPMIGVKTGCVQSGVQITLFVQNSANFDKMQQFYSSILGVSPYPRSFSGDVCGVKYSTFPISHVCEFLLVCVPDQLFQSNKNMLLFCEAKADRSSMTEMCSGYAAIKDHEENEIIIFEQLK